MNRADSPPGLSPLATLAAGTVIVSFTAPIVRLLAVAPTVTAFYRMVFGGAILLVLVLVQRRRLPLTFPAFLYAGICAVAFAGDLSMWHRSIRLVGPGLATILVGFQVFFMAGFGIAARRERPSWRIVLAVPLAVLGLFLIIGADWRHAVPGYRLGVGFGLASAVCYTVYLLSLRRLSRSADLAGRMANIALVSVLGAAALCPIALSQRESFAIPSLESAGLLVLLGIIGQVLAWVLMSGSLPRMRYSLVGLVLLLQPLLASVWDVLFFRRPTTAIEVMGAALALGAIYLGTTAAGEPG